MLLDLLLRAKEDRVFEKYTDYPFLREQNEDLLAKTTRVIYKTHRVVPNLKLGWNSEDLLNLPNVYWGLSNLPLKENKLLLKHQN